METFIYKFENKRIEQFESIIYLPEEVMKQKSIPLMVFLHGAGERGPDFKWIYENGFPKYLKEGEEFPTVILAPQCPADFTWNMLTVELKELIDFVVKKYGIDEDRISITGLSMGGFGTWEMICCYPDFFSAAAPICGGGMGWRLFFSNNNTPIWAFHGDEDITVPISHTIDMYDSLKRRGADNMRFTVYHGVGHECWDEAYHTTKVIEWLTTSVRDKNR